MSDHYQHCYMQIVEAFDKALKDLRAKFETGWIPKDTRRDPMQCRVCRM
jgi:hypothetical protein